MTVSARKNKKKITFRTSVDVADSILTSHQVLHQDPIAIRDGRRTAHTFKQTEYWTLPTKTVKSAPANAHPPSCVLTSNSFSALENDELTEYGMYKSSYTFDTGSSGNYGDTSTLVKNRRKIKKGTGIRVTVANEQVMEQIGSGELPFDNIPNDINDVQLFDRMQSPLISAGKFAKAGYSMVLDKNSAKVVQGNTKNKIQSVMENAQNEDIVLSVPFDERSLTWKTSTKPAPPTVANNVHRIRSKAVLVDFLHRAAGYSGKKNLA